MQTHYTHIHNHTHGTRERLILIPVKTKWYIFPSAGQAWDVHHHVYRDYENLIHNITSNVLLINHTDEKMHWTVSTNTQGDELAAKKLVHLTPSDHSHKPAIDQCDPLTLCKWPLSGWPSYWPAWTMNQHQVAVPGSTLCYFSYCLLHFGF